MTKEELQKNGEHWYELYKKEKTENEQLKAQIEELLGIVQGKDGVIEKMKCCENCAYRTVDLLTFKPFCDKRKLEIENPLTCKCDKWELVN